MTCIVGLEHKGKVYIGGDSAGVAGLDLTVRGDKKVFRNGEFIMGFTSSFRMGQLIGYSLNAPKPREGTALFAYMVTDFVDAVRACFKNGGYAEKQNESEKGGFFLVGVRGRLFKIQCDYQVSEYPCGYAALGCGDQIALGAMHQSVGKPPKDRILGALSAAEQFSAGVRAPFHVEIL